MCDLHREFKKSSWAACIKRIYEIDPLECPALGMSLLWPFPEERRTGPMEKDALIA